MSRVAVNKPIGRAKTQTKGMSRPIAWAKRSSWPLRRKGKISRRTLTMSKTKVKTARVSAREARTWRVRYACSVLKRESHGSHGTYKTHFQQVSQRAQAYPSSVALRLSHASAQWKSGLSLATSFQNRFE